MAFKTHFTESQRDGTQRRPARSGRTSRAAWGMRILPASMSYRRCSSIPRPPLKRCRSFSRRIASFSEAGAIRSNRASRGGLRRHDVRGDIAVVNSASPLISDAVIEHGRVSDLVLLSQVDSTGSQGVELDFVDRVVMGVGRPVLVLPLKAKPVESIGTAIVAWNGSARRRAPLSTVCRCCAWQRRCGSSGRSATR